MLEPVRGYQDGSCFRAGEMTDYVEGLEVVTESVVIPDGNGKQQTVIVTSVEGSGYGVDTQFLAGVEAVSLKRNRIHIDLGSKTAVPYQGLEGAAKTFVFEVTDCRVYVTFHKGIDYSALQFRFEVGAHKLPVLVQIWILALAPVLFLPFQHVEAQIRGSKVA